MPHPRKLVSKGNVSSKLIKPMCSDSINRGTSCGSRSSLRSSSSSSSRSSSSTVRLVAGVEYECSDTLGLMPPTEGDGVRPEDEFIADDALRLFYAGDFASRRTPGFEAAALSGRACAEHMLSLASLFPKVK